MNSNANESKVDSDLADRLDVLFDENEPAEKPAQTQAHSSDPLDELKSLVMSIEWEITDEVMERFLGQIEAVKTRLEADRILVMFLQLLGSLGLYIKTNKGKAHPNAFKLLNSVYQSFEKAASTGSISPSEKKKLLYLELNKYKELKGQIETVREPEAGPTPRIPASAEPKDAVKPKGGGAGNGSPGRPGAGVTQDYFDEAIRSFQARILKELAAIREDLARLTKP